MTNRVLLEEVGGGGVQAAGILGGLVPTDGLIFSSTGSNATFDVTS